ncbi:MAG TPA: THUMP domain-containing protein [Novimethylophilus sp.]|jgi:putative N6-adenine-specific DNA methylase|uniref:THUMP domain-containing class I SAM-dependent RNA methyltransferase n=1 Tax=Novimethylophilus sp. TaxID=2137426 RepID=UPI002F3E68BF
MKKNQHTFFATCPRGLEPVLAQELTAIGAADVKPTDGGASFAGDVTLAYRANLESRVATRVLWRLSSAPYRTEDDIYKAAFALPWPSWFDVGRTMMVKVTAVKCPLKSLEFITLRIKDAVCDRFRNAGGTRPSIDTREPDVRIHAYLTATECQIYLDTSGAALFQRGHRKASVDAPLRENLAAGIIKLTGWQPGAPLLDPMCGSGTFLIEAALIALDIAPGSGRAFAFEKLKNFDAAAWKILQEQAKKRAKPASPLPIFGSDSDMRAVRAARQNLEAAGFSNVVQVRQADILEAEAPAPQGILLTNPPYGVRIGEEEQLAELYPQLAAALKRNFAGWNAFFLTSDNRLPKLMRLAPSRKTPLFNGALECRLYEFKMVAGSNRKTVNE